MTEQLSAQPPRSLSIKILRARPLPPPNILVNKPNVLPNIPKPKIYEECKAAVVFHDVGNKKKAPTIHYDGKCGYPTTSLPTGRRLAVLGVSDFHCSVCNEKMS